MAWRVNLDRLRQYCSSDGGLAIDIEKYHQAEIDAYDLNELSEIPIRQTIQELLNGECNHPEIGFQYGYALELLCPLCGDRLDNDEVYPLSMDYFDAIDLAWKDLGLADILSMNKFVWSGSPIKIPFPDEFPIIGYLSAAECNVAFERLFDEDVNHKFDLTAPDFPITVLKQISDWICIATQMEQSIICFYY
jgi:hypothetical protein